MFLFEKRRIFNKLCSIVKVVKFYSTINIQNNIERYGKLAGITKKVTPHQLKHSTTTHF
jgi:site-specific recombinase XerD